MKNFKKAVALCLVMLMVFSIAGCGKKTDGDTSSTGSSATTGLDLSGGFGGGVKLENIDTAIYTANPTFSWSGLKDGQTMNLKLVDAAGNVVFDKTGLTGTSYQCEVALTNFAEYTLFATYNNESGEAKKVNNVNKDGDKVICLAGSSANDGKDYSISKNGVSENAINNILDRGITYAVDFYDGEDVDEAARFLTNVGAKYVQRASGEWHASNNITVNMEKIKQHTARIHAADPEIILEACIFETTTPLVNKIAIPDWVFKAFGQKVETRNFNMDKCINPSGDGVNKMGLDAHIPDITQLEHQMFVYYRACQYIDAGFEALHLGQVALIGSHDKNYECWTKVVKMIREYAKDHARRGYVLINAHDTNFKAPNGDYLVDMIVAPLRVCAASNATSGLATEKHPQYGAVNTGHAGNVIGKSWAGKSPSGWYSASYPYIVEFDNYEQAVTSTHTNPGDLWGWDEINWYSNQPQWYREDFMEYLENYIKKLNQNGHACYVGHRGGYTHQETGKSMQFYANNPKYKYKDIGNNDEAWIKRLIAQ